MHAETIQDITKINSVLPTLAFLPQTLQKVHVSKAFMMGLNWR